MPHLLSGEAVSPEAARHLRECAVCSREAETLRLIMTRLRAAPEGPALPDLAPRILQRIREEKTRRHAVHRIGWQTGAAAALVALLGAAVWQFRKPAGQPFHEIAAVPQQSAGGKAAAETSPVALRASFERALDWLCQNQDGDGSWDAARWGGQNRFRISLTALGALALMSANADSPHRTEPAARAVSWLISQQRKDGCFGAPPSLEPYDHSLSLLAVLRAAERGLAEPEPQALAAAMHQLLHQPVPERFQADPLLARWHHSAVALAAAMNVPGASDALPRFADAAAAISPESAAPSPGGPVDFSNAWLLTGTAPGTREDPARRDALLAALSVLQSRDGPASGSWPPDARWGKAGGRVHSTALAALSISSAGLHAE